MNVLLTGATGYIGGRLLPRLVNHQVVCLTRQPRRMTVPPGVQVRAGDVLTGEGLDDALRGVDVAYYFVHAMGGRGDFAVQDRRSAQNFAAACRRQGVRRIVYLGGLGPDDDGSKHLRSRQETAALLHAGAPEFVYARAAAVLGGGSASFLMLRHLVERLPVMICPRWIDVPTQPIGIDDLLAALLACGEQPGLHDEVQLGGRDVVSYREMMLALARAEERRLPAIVRVPLLTPRLSSYWMGLVTSVPVGVARPLVEGLKFPTVVVHPPPPGINDRPLGIAEAMRRALQESTD